MADNDNNLKSARRCPACGAAAGKYRGPKNGFKFFDCSGCGTLFTSHVPAGSDAKDYDDYYVPENMRVPEFINRRVEEIVAGFEPYRHNNRMLDLGCGAGHILLAAKRAGWEAKGVEISPKAVEHVRSQGGDVFCGRLEESAYPEGHFDVVASSEVLEHVDDPVGFVAEVRRVLRPGGLFWATTPHGRGISAKLLGLNWSIVVPPDHLHLFSLKGVRRLLESAGFRSVKVVAHAVNPYELLDGVRNRARREEVGTEQLNKERIQTSYQLNELLTSSPSRQAIRSLANGVLGLARLGDDLKIRAVK